MIEVSSPPTIRSRSCVPQAPGAGKSAAVKDGAAPVEAQHTWTFAKKLEKLNGT